MDVGSGYSPTRKLTEETQRNCRKTGSVEEIYLQRWEVLDTNHSWSLSLRVADSCGTWSPCDREFGPLADLPKFHRTCSRMDSDPRAALRRPFARLCAEKNKTILSISVRLPLDTCCCGATASLERDHGGSDVS
jgi:hypothetical protein